MMSAPCSSGRSSQGVARVLSTMSGTPTSWATSATPRDVEDVVLGVADGLPEEGLGVGLRRGPPGLEVVGVGDEVEVDAELGQRVLEQVEGAPVERRRSNDVVAGTREVEDGERGRGLARGDLERAGKADGGVGRAFERGDPRLDDSLGGVHDAGVDVADLGEREQVRGVLGVAELVRSGLVDRRCGGARGRIRLGAGVDLLGLETPVVIRHGRDATRPNPDCKGQLCA